MLILHTTNIQGGPTKLQVSQQIQLTYVDQATGQFLLDTSIIQARYISN